MPGATALLFCWEHSNYLSDYRSKWPSANSWLQNDDVVPNSLGFFDYQDDFKFLRLEEQVGAGYNKTILNLAGLMNTAANKCHKEDKLKKCIVDIYGFAVVAAEGVETAIAFKTESLDYIVDATGWALRSSADTLPLLPLFWADGQDDIDFDFTFGQLLEIVDEHGNYIDPQNTLKKIYATNVYNAVHYSNWKKFDSTVFDKYYFPLLFGYTPGYVNILRHECGKALDIKTKAKQLCTGTRSQIGSVLNAGSANCGGVYESGDMHNNPIVHRQSFELFDNSPTTYVPDGALKPNKRAWPVCSTGRVAPLGAQGVWNQMLNRNDNTFPKFLLTHDQRFWNNHRMPPEGKIPSSHETCISLCEFLTDPRISSGSGHCYIDNVNPCIPIGVANDSTPVKKGEFYSTCNFTNTVADILTNDQFKEVTFDQEGPKPNCSFGSPEYPYNGVYDCVNMWTMMFCDFLCLDDFGYPTPCFVNAEDDNAMFSPTTSPVEPTVFPVVPPTPPKPPEPVIRTTTTTATVSDVSTVSTVESTNTDTEDDGTTIHLHARDIQAMPKSMQNAVSGGASIVTLIIMLYDAEDWLDWFLQLFKSKKLDEEKLAAAEEDEKESFEKRQERVNRMEIKVSQVRTATMQMMNSTSEFSRRGTSLLPESHQDTLGALEEGVEVGENSIELEYEDGSSVSLSRF